MRFLKLGFLFFLVFLVRDGHTAPQRKQRKSTLQFTVEDPTLKKSTTSSSQGSMIQKPTELPSALLSGALQNSAKSDLPDETLGQINYGPLRELAEIGDWRGLETATSFLLSMRADLHEGERLRLELVRALALSKLGSGVEALRRVRFYKKYLDFALADLRQLRDITRLKELKAHLILTEHDILNAPSAR